MEQKSKKPFIQLKQRVNTANFAAPLIVHHLILLQIHNVN